MDIFDNPYVQARIHKASSMRTLGLNPYSNDAKKTISNGDFNARYAYMRALESSDPKRREENVTHHVAGRVKLLRMMGKACFFTIQDGSMQGDNLQIYISKNDVGDDFELLKKHLEVGDFICVMGYPFVTKTNELSLHAREACILTKALVPLPEKFHGLSDIELRYRARYLDLIMNPDVRKVFYVRSQIVSLLRKFFESKGFLEVETPMLHPIPGGANARPFITHHNALGVDRYLRIAPELYLKRLIVGGFEAIFEINRNFRNEGMDHSHNPEFSMIEFYWAYKTYHDLIELTKEMFAFLLDGLGLPKKLSWGDFEVDFDSFDVLTYKESILKFSSLSKEALDSKNALFDALKGLGLKVDSAMSYGKLLESSFEHFVEENLINPTFITEYPVDISPLARKSDANPQIAERFELFIAGKEIANGFSELNDPLDQLERFKAQVALKDAGDDEAQFMDEDYITALSYGMPPTAGQGIGVDRLVMLLTDSKSIKDVIFFPAMRS